MRVFSRLRVVLVVFAGMFCHCGADPFVRMRTTRVSREHRVMAPAPADAYFAAVYGYQVALSEVDRRRAEHMAGLARALGLLENADRAELAAALQAKLREAGATRMRVRFEDPGSLLETRLTAWFEALRAPPEDEQRAREEQRARYEAAADVVVVTLTPDHESEALVPIVRALSALLHDAEATRRCMERLGEAHPPALAQGEELRRSASSDLRREIDAAERFLQGVHAKVTLHAQESVRLERWVFGTLAPGSEDNPEEGTHDEGALSKSGR